MSMVALISLFLIGIIYSTGKIDHLFKGLKLEKIWRDLAFLVLVIIIFWGHGDVVNYPLSGAGLFLIFIEKRDFIRERRKNFQLLGTWLFLFIIEALGLETNLKMISLAAIGFMFSFIGNHKKLKYLYLFLLALIALMNFSIDNQNMTLLYPLIGLLPLRMTALTKRNPYYFLICFSLLILFSIEIRELPGGFGLFFATALAITGFLTNFEKIKDSIFIFIPVIIVFQEMSEAIKWVVLSAPLLEICLEYQHRVSQVVLSYKAKEKGELTLSYKQIVLIALLLLGYSGLNGSFFHLLLANNVTSSTVVSLTLIFLIFSKKAELLNCHNKINDGEVEQNYFIFRAVLVFILTFLSISPKTLVFDPMSISFLFVTISSSVVFKKYPFTMSHIKSSFEKYSITPIESDVFLGSKIAPLYDRTKSQTVGEIRKWRGYSYSFELSLIFFGLLTLIYWEAL